MRTQEIAVLCVAATGADTDPALYAMSVFFLSLFYFFIFTYIFSMLYIDIWSTVYNESFCENNLFTRILYRSILSSFYFYR